MDRSGSAQVRTSLCLCLPNIYCVPVSRITVGSTAQRHTVPLRRGRSLSSDLFTGVPSNYQKEVRNGARRGGSQPRVLSQANPARSSFGSVPQGHSETCRSLLDCPDQGQLSLVKGCLQGDINSQALLALRAPRERNSDSLRGALHQQRHRCCWE